MEQIKRLHAYDELAEDWLRLKKQLHQITKVVGLWSGYQYESHPEVRLEIQQLTGDILKILNQSSTGSTIDG